MPNSEMPPDNLDADSLDLVELAIALEEELGDYGNDHGDSAGDREPRTQPPTLGSGAVALEVEPAQL